MIIDIITWITIGSIVGGFTLLLVVVDSKLKVFVNIVLGVIGALMAGSLMRMLSDGDVSVFSLSGILVATIGSGMLIFLFNTLTRSEKKL